MVLEPGSDGHNAPSWICIGNSKLGSVNMPIGQTTGKAKSGFARRIDVVFEDGRVEHYDSKREVIKKYHVDKMYLNEYIKNPELSIKKRGMIFIDASNRARCA